MRIAQVVGTVTLSRSHPSFQGARLRLAVPLSLAELAGGGPLAAEELVVWDELAAGVGQRVAMSEGSEAAQPFRPQIKPVDAYVAAILDEVHLALEAPG
jgi:ethanolamine utilization protein EutN